MKKYRVIKIVEETYYIFADTEDDALSKLYSGELYSGELYSGELYSGKIEEIGIRISELIE